LLAKREILERWMAARFRAEQTERNRASRVDHMSGAARPATIPRQDARSRFGKAQADPERFIT